MARMVPALSYKSLPTAPRFAAMEDALGYILERLAEVSLRQAIVIDLKSHMDDFAFVYVCVPGLEFAANKPNYTPGERMLAFIAALRKKAA
jgi:ribosomal protein S12 methylthiotransferase accessory factor